MSKALARFEKLFFENLNLLIIEMKYKLTQSNVNYFINTITKLIENNFPIHFMKDHKIEIEYSKIEYLNVFTITLKCVVNDNCPFTTFEQFKYCDNRLSSYESVFLYNDGTQENKLINELDIQYINLLSDNVKEFYRHYE